jgi:hypothetical protein
MDDEIDGLGLGLGLVSLSNHRRRTNQEHDFKVMLLFNYDRQCPYVIQDLLTHFF